MHLGFLTLRSTALKYSMHLGDFGVPSPPSASLSGDGIHKTNITIKKKQNIKTTQRLKRRKSNLPIFRCSTRTTTTTENNNNNSSQQQHKSNYTYRNEKMTSSTTITSKRKITTYYDMMNRRVKRCLQK